MYSKFFKRLFDFCIALIGLIVLSPLLLVLTIAGSIAMKGNPFFIQMRPGMIDKKTGEEKVFPLIKFRTMSNAKDKEGKLLSDEQRLNKYGRILRSTSLDELPELINILVGHLSCVGPRPLLVRYLPYFTQEERIRHTVRPGLTGYAQVHGRNVVTWDERLELDSYYVKNISLIFDIKIILKTISVVLKREGTDIKDLEAFDVYRKRQTQSKNKSEFISAK